VKGDDSDELVEVLQLFAAQLAGIRSDLAKLGEGVGSVDGRLKEIEAGMRIVNKIVDQHEPAFRELAHAAQ